MTTGARDAAMSAQAIRISRVTTMGYRDVRTALGWLKLVHGGEVNDAEVIAVHDERMAAGFISDARACVETAWRRTSGHDQAI